MSKKIMRLSMYIYKEKDIEVVIPPVDCCFLVETKVKTEDTKLQAGQGKKNRNIQEAAHINAIPIYSPNNHIPTRCLIIHKEKTK